MGSHPRCSQNPGAEPGRRTGRFLGGVEYIGAGSPGGGARARSGVFPVCWEEGREVRLCVGTETGRGIGVFIPWPEPGHPLAHCLCRVPVVRHYKVKREGTKYVIDVEEPVSDGPGFWEAHWRDPRPFPSGPNRFPYPPPRSPAPHSMQWSTISCCTPRRRWCPSYWTRTTRRC